MQEHYYLLYVFTVQSQWWSGNPPLVDFADSPYNRGRSYTHRFCIKMTAKDARTATKIILRKKERFRVSGKKL